MAPIASPLSRFQLPVPIYQQVNAVRNIFLTFLACWLPATARAEGQWLEDFQQAVTLATQANKPILIDFTGSDWCGWCKKLDADTFSQSAFLDYASKNLILLRLDFPHHKSQPDDVKKANEALQQQYQVRGFPSVLLINSSGSVLWKQVGYAPGGPAGMIAKINQSHPAATQANVPTPSPAPAAPPVAQAPTTPLPAPKPAGDEPKLQAILYSNSHRAIILGGKTVEEGDSVNGMHVLKIARDKVVVEWGGEAKELRID